MAFDLDDIQRNAVSADSVKEMIEVFKEGVEYVELSEVEGVINEIESYLNCALDDVKSAIRRCN